MSDSDDTLRCRKCAAPLATYQWTGSRWELAPDARLSALEPIDGVPRFGLRSAQRAGRATSRRSPLPGRRMPGSDAANRIGIQARLAYRDKPRYAWDWMDEIKAAVSLPRLERNTVPGREVIIYCWRRGCETRHHFADVDTDASTGAK